VLGLAIVIVLVIDARWRRALSATTWKRMGESESEHDCDDDCESESEHENRIGRGGSRTLLEAGQEGVQVMTPRLSRSLRALKNIESDIAER
jgi:hypothetical protein